MISLFKIILLIPFLLILLFFLFKPKEKLFIRVFIFTISILAIGFIMFPSVTNVVANALDIGRGADLIVYIYIVFSFFAIIYLYTKVRYLTQTSTDIIRELSITKSEMKK